MGWNKIICFIGILFLINIISGICNENQIDINSASESELDELYGIGSVKAKAIIGARPFESVDDLIKVNGIGEITLNKIKEQGLACVNFIEKNNFSEENSTQKNQTNEIINETFKEPEIIKEPEKEIELIVLTPKTIKTEENKKTLDKNDYAMYGLIGFCCALALLFLIKKRKSYKNEFD